MSRMDTQSEHNDRHLVGAVAKREILRRYGNASSFARKTGISRKTLERVFAGVPTVDQGTLDFMEGELDLPRDTFRSIEAHDMTALKRTGVEADLIRWVQAEMARNLYRRGAA